MSSFPTTSTTLLANLAERESGIDQVEWNRFFALYYPVMVEFARARGAGDDSEDVVQEVFADLVKVFQAGRYVRGKGQFKSYLATMLRNELISRFRRMQARSRIIDGWAGAHASSDIASQCSLRSGDMPTALRPAHPDHKPLLTAEKGKRGTRQAASLPWVSVLKNILRQRTIKMNPMFRYTPSSLTVTA